MINPSIVMTPEGSIAFIGAVLVGKSSEFVGICPIDDALPSVDKSAGETRNQPPLSRGAEGPLDRGRHGHPQRMLTIILRDCLRRSRSAFASCGRAYRSRSLCPSCFARGQR